MARQTRQQRRARRAQQQPALAGGSPPAAPPPAQRPVDSGDSRPEPRKPDAKSERRYPGAGTVRFIRESWGELQKVEWPSQRGVVSGTAVVLIACIIVGAFLWLNDQLWRYVVQHILLK